MAKKILGVMIVILVLIVSGGSLYLASMGGIQHGSTKTSANTTKSSTSNDSMNNMTNDTQKGNIQEPGTQEGTSSDKGNSQSNSNNPVIIQVTPQVQQAHQVDPKLYVEQLKQKLQTIDEANTSIASGTDGKTSAEGFYKLGRNVTEMENTLDSLSKNLDQQPQNGQAGAAQPNMSQPNMMQPNTIQPNVQGSQLYISPQGQVYMIPQQPGQASGTNQMQQGQMQQSQQGQQQGMNQQDANQQNMSGQMSGMSSDTSSTNHSSMSLGGFMNASSIQSIFGIILLVSIVLAIIAVIGFIGSIFKAPKVNNDVISE